jgi:hypothetical protein
VDKNPIEDQSIFSRVPGKQRHTLLPGGSSNLRKFILSSEQVDRLPVGMNVSLFPRRRAIPAVGDVFFFCVYFYIVLWGSTNV